MAVCELSRKPLLTPFTMVLNETRFIDFLTGSVAASCNSSGLDISRCASEREVVKAINGRKTVITAQVGFIYLRRACKGDLTGANSILASRLLGRAFSVISVHLYGSSNLLNAAQNPWNLRFLVRRLPEQFGPYVSY